MRILLTRPQELSSSLAQKLISLGHEVMIDPMIEISPCSSPLPSFSPYQGIVTTSQTAIQCLAKLTDQRNFSLWCVGTESERIAKQLGFNKIHNGEGSAASLSQMLLDYHVSPTLHLTSDVVRLDIAQFLNDNGLRADRLVIYETRESTGLLTTTIQAIQLQAIDAILFYSPRTAQLFHQLLDDQLKVACQAITAACLSESIGIKIRDVPWKKMIIANNTSTDDLLENLLLAE